MCWIIHCLVGEAYPRAESSLTAYSARSYAALSCLHIPPIRPATLHANTHRLPPVMSSLALDKSPCPHAVLGWSADLAPVCKQIRPEELQATHRAWVFGLRVSNASACRQTHLPATCPHSVAPPVFS